MPKYPPLPQSAPGLAARLSSRRSLIQQAYEVDPLVCPRCAAAMRIIAFFEEPEVIEKILTHLPASADGKQGVVAHPRPQHAEGGPVAVLWATSHRRPIAASRIHAPAGC